MSKNNKKYHIIYKTTNLKNNKFYIGLHSTDVLEDGYLGSGTKFNRALNYYGKKNFKRELLFTFKSRTEASEKERELVNENFIKRKDTYNVILGGELFDSTGTITVKDKNGNFSRVSVNDPKYLSGELKFNLKNMVPVKDKDGKKFHVKFNDPKYLSGEYKHFNVGNVITKDKNGKFFRVKVDDPKYLNGDLVGITKGKTTVKDKQNNFFQINVNDSKILSGELTYYWSGKKHKEETIIKMRKSHKGKQDGAKNSQYGTCWITNEKENKKIKKCDLIPEGWKLGRKQKINNWM